MIKWRKQAEKRRHWQAWRTQSGYTGSWPEHSSPITANTTITAVYTPIPTEPSEPPAATHTVTFRVTYSASYGYTVKTMTVEDGYVLTAADYPTTYGITWQQYTSPITSDVTVNGTYSWGGYGAAEEAEATGEIPAEVAAESTAVSRTGSTTLVKTVTETYDYVYNGDRLSQVKKTTSTTTSSGTTNATDTLNFTYDANGTPMSVKYNGTMYYFVTNLQGDVTAILNTSGTAVASYTYDAWGNILTTGGSMASTLGTLNPLRYRGYVYDTETGRYYLQSRYYNPVMGRFINADSQLNTGSGMLGSNLFSYCENSPVGYDDADGHEMRSVLQEPIASGGYFGGISFLVLPFIIIKEAINSITTNGTKAQSDEQQKIQAKLENSLAKITTSKEYKREEELHHIVPQQATATTHAREIIIELLSGGINNPANLMPVKTVIHRRLHTQIYYLYVDFSITTAYNMAGGDPEKQMDNVLVALGAIRAFIDSLNWMA